MNCYKEMIYITLTLLLLFLTYSTYLLHKRICKLEDYKVPQNELKEQIDTLKPHVEESTKNNNEEHLDQIPKCPKPGKTPKLPKLHIDDETKA